jgi:hypothetical protein
MLNLLKCVLEKYCPLLTKMVVDYAIAALVSSNLD